MNTKIIFSKKCLEYGSVHIESSARIRKAFEILKDKNRNSADRVEAGCSLGNLKAEDAIPILIAILKQKGEHFSMEKDSYVRSNAARALGLMGAKAKNAVPILTECLDDESPRIRKSAATALEKIRG